MLSESGLSDALSDMEEVDLPRTQVTLSNDGAPVSLTAFKKRKFVPAHGLRHLGTAKRATVRLTEIGPRLTLKLIKIEEGLNTGTVLYHRWQSRSLNEVADQAERLRQREALRALRRSEHEARRAANEAAREAHRQACLEGMRRLGQLPKQSSPEDLKQECAAASSELDVDDDDDQSPTDVKSAKRRESQPFLNKHSQTTNKCKRKLVLPENLKRPEESRSRCLTPFQAGKMLQKSRIVVEI
ncbi:unnamed protein product [Echinostoma caproni]|uniref:Brix domain-containing protein n=1 Tax=Echinostoma caproni TaxID=27848 RepID=A0A183AQM8_9TREM|nr:unnamed protein product [Echinostoma caproni]